MRKLATAAQFLVLAAAFSCSAPANNSGSAPAQGTAPSPSGSPSPVENAIGCPPAELEASFKQIAPESNGKVGVAASVLEGGPLVALNAAERFPMQSVYKVPIAMTVLQQVEQGKLTLEQRIRVEPADFLASRYLQQEYPNGGEVPVRQLLRFMVSNSDGTACDVILRTVGGPGEVTKYLRSLGLEEIVVANYEREMAADQKLPKQNWATPVEMLRLLRLLHEGKGISSSHRELLLDLMINSRPGPKRIKGLLPAQTVVAHKTGTGRTVEGEGTVTNDVGIITLPNGQHLALVVFLAEAKADLATRELVIAKTADAAWRCYAKR